MNRRAFLNLVCGGVVASAVPFAACRRSEAEMELHIQRAVSKAMAEVMDAMIAFDRAVRRELNMTPVLTRAPRAAGD